MQSLPPKLLLPVAHALGAGAAACLLVAWYALLQAPLLEREQTNNRRTAELEQGLRDAVEVRREHVQLTKQLEDLNQTVAGVRKRLPAVSIESRFLARAISAAEVQQIGLEDYRRDGLNVGNRYGEVRVRLQGSGSHAAICRFIKNLSDFPHAAVLKRLEINSSSATDSYPFTLTYLLYHDIAADNAQTASTASPNRSI